MTFGELKVGDVFTVYGEERLIKIQEIKIPKAMIPYIVFYDRYNVICISPSTNQTVITSEGLRALFERNVAYIIYDFTKVNKLC